MLYWIKHSYVKWSISFLNHAALSSISNTSMQEETGWRRRLLRKALNWPHCVTPSPSTPRAPMLSSRPSSPHNTLKVIIHTHTHTSTVYAFTVWALGGWMSRMWFKLTKMFLSAHPPSSQCMMGWASESLAMRRFDLTGVSSPLSEIRGFSQGTIELLWRLSDFSGTIEVKEIKVTHLLDHLPLKRCFTLITNESPCCIIFHVSLLMKTCQTVM